MSYRETFYVYQRILKSGKKIYYYQVYLEDGSAKSTGQTSKGLQKPFVSNWRRKIV
ncbi:MAG: hypothetical protein PF447_06000 [Spirochaetaceae bacterium]|nr:hypothetical protein [Spirochaetaceae bacterium]